MYRKAIEELKKWKYSPHRKPLIIQGARQVGKTWLMKEFGRQEYKDTAYVNFDENSMMQNLFSSDINVTRIISGIEIYIGKKIDPVNTLIIFDEVQEVPRALSSLKYFYEEAPQYQIVCAGSLLGIALHKGTSFPVGKVEFLRIYPMSFSEFLIAEGYKTYADLISDQNFEMMDVFSAEFTDLLKRYYFVGGMPESVQRYVEEHDLISVRKIQEQILKDYEQDFSKHVPYNVVPRIRAVWNSLPSQLAKENRKFVYGLVREGARAKDYETAIMWLSDCGLVHKVSRVGTPRLPLDAYEDLKAFKLYSVDVGLMSCMSGLRQKTILDGNSLFTEFKGSLTEQYVLQQLKCISDLNIYYYTNDRGSCEIDFVVDNGELVIPVEVKAEENLKAKSLRTYREKYNPSLSVRISMSGYRRQDSFVNLPLYAVEAFGSL